MTTQHTPLPAAWHMDWEQIERDTRIRAASPELLDALEALMVTIDAQINAGLRWDPEEVAAARAAIAKARGE
jgi:hypothetical protein